MLFLKLILKHLNAIIDGLHQILLKFILTTI